MPSQRAAGELLDVEDDDSRQQRIKSLLENTDAAMRATRKLRPSPTLPPSKPHPVPLSDLISRAEAFLPRLAASNADLARRAALDPSSVDIEHLGENTENAHIEMNLGLGVFERRLPPGHGSINRPENEQLPNSSSGDGSSDSDSESRGDESEGDDSDESEGLPHVTETAGKPDILVLDSKYNDKGS